MTQKEIANLLGLKKDAVKHLFQLARKLCPSIEKKSKTYQRTGVTIDYTFEETIAALSLSKNGLSVAEREILKQEFINPTTAIRKNTWGKFIQGSEDFNKELKKNSKYKCCSTCIYCFARVKRTKYHPFCSFYNKYLSLMKANPYKSYCNTYDYTGYAFFWKKNGEPEKKFITKQPKENNLNSFGFSDEVYFS